MMETIMWFAVPFLLPATWPGTVGYPQVSPELD